MNLMKRYSPSRYYGNTSFYLCTCGLSVKTQGLNQYENCPNCNARYEGYLDDKTNFSIVKSNIQGHIFKGTKTILNVKVVKKSDEDIKLVKEKEDTYDITFNFLEKSLEIKLNGAVIKNTKTNIAKVFSRFSLDWYNSNEKDFNLFNSYASFFKTESFLETYKNMIEYPQLEVLFNTYGSLEVFKGIDVKEFKVASTPAEILELPKPVFKKIYEILSEMSRYSDKFKHSINIIKEFSSINKNKPDYICSVLDSIHSLGIYGFVKEYIYLLSVGYEHKRLYSYIEDDIYTYQGISKPSEGLELLVDYVKMSKEMNVDFDKYPRSLKLSHDLASKNYELVTSEEEIEMFKVRIKDNAYAELEYSKDSEEYIVLNPDEILDIVNEGRHLSHCVQSYIKKIIKGETKITFMRNKKSPSKSLITLEVEDGFLKQYKGFSNRHPNEKEMKFIKNWVKVKNIEMY